MGLSSRLWRDSVYLTVFLFFFDITPSQVHEKVEGYELNLYSPFEAAQRLNVTREEQYLWYEFYVCSRSRRCAKRIKIPQCAKCHQDESCFQYGDCCSNILLKANRSSSHLSLPLECQPMLGSPISYFLVTTCSENNDVTDVVDKCRNPNGTNWRHVLPVTDIRNGTSYRNRYCALCNGVQSYRQWEIAVDCSMPYHDPDVLSRAPSVDDLFSQILLRGACHLEVSPPRDLDPRPCTPKPRETISACNLTGNWEVYDERVERACAEFPVAYYGSYRNVFCFLCNRNMEWRQKDCSTGPPWTTSLTAVLNLQEDESDVSTQREHEGGGAQSQTCGSKAVCDPATAECRPLMCDVGKTLHNRTCVSHFSRASLIGYVFNLEATLTTDVDTLVDSDFLLADTRSKISDHFEQIPGFRVQFFSFRVVSISCIDAVILELSIRVQLSPHFQYGDNDESAIRLLSLCTGIGINGTNNRFFLSANLSGAQGLSRPPEPTTVVCEKENTTLSLTSYWELSLPPFYVSGVLPTVVPLTRFLVCGQVEFLPHEFTILSLNDSQYLQLLVPPATERTKRFRLRDSNVRVCLEDYLSLFKESRCEEARDRRRISSGNAVSGIEGKTTSTSRRYVTIRAGIVSFVCSVVSLVFLAVSFAAHLLLRDTKSATGVCTICMIVVLFLAQAVFEFGAEQTEIAGLCVALGVLAHYLWLSATFWMNACTALMFYRLMFPLIARVRLSSRCRVLALLSLYAFLTPAAIVAASMAANHGLHGDLGYGGAICYIKRAATRRLGLALPIGTLILINLVLFSCTVVHLRRGPQISSSKETKVGLFACARLSVITGVSWTFLFVQEAVGSPVLEYVVIVLFGLYGVAVFWSLALNSHVIGLCRTWLRGEKSVVTGTSAGSVVRSRAYENKAVPTE